MHVGVYVSVRGHVVVRMDRVCVTVCVLRGGGGAWPVCGLQLLTTTAHVHFTLARTLHLAPTRNIHSYDYHSIPRKPYHLYTSHIPRPLHFHPYVHSTYRCTT